MRSRAPACAAAARGRDWVRTLDTPGILQTGLEPPRRGEDVKVEAGLLSRLAAQWYGSAPALTCGDSTLSFGELNAGANRIGSGLLAAGVVRGDRVGVLAYNSSEVVEAWLGCEKHNLVRAVLHTHIPADAHARTLDHIEATALVFDSRLAEVVDSFRDRLRTVRVFAAIGPDVPEWAVPFRELQAGGSAEDPLLDVDEDAP